MSTSGIDRDRRLALRAARNYLYAALFCAFFGGVYEHFGHGVYSYFMLYAFGFPLALGTLPCLLTGMKRHPRLPSAAARKLWGAGVAALTVGSLFKGVLDIYGTESGLGAVYWVVGGGLLLLSLLLRFVAARRDGTSPEASF